MSDVKRVFVDTARNEKLHACYDPGIDKFFEVMNLSELRDYDEIYLDSSLFPNMWGSLRELIIFDGRRVYHFSWPWIWRKLRELYRGELKRFGDLKSDHRDAWILYKFYADFRKLSRRIWFPSLKPFQEITWIDVELKPLLIEEKALADTLQRLRNLLRCGINAGSGTKLIDEELIRIRLRIIEKAKDVWRRFIDIARELNLSDADIGGLTGLAGTLTYLGWPAKNPSMHRARRYFGLYKVAREDKLKYMERTGEKFRKKYSGNARRYLLMLTTAISNKIGVFPPKARHQKEVLKKLISLLKSNDSITALRAG